jgi:hypothetical protein
MIAAPPANPAHPPGASHGASEGCPFCLAARRSLPMVGARFRLLSGFQAGRIGTVVQSPAAPPWPPEEFLAHMDGEPLNHQRRITSIDIIDLLPGREPPSWAPPVELRVAVELDQAVVAFCEAGNVFGRWSINWSAYFEIVRLIWSRRLPILSVEVWAVLRAHGIPDSYKDELSEFFDKGRDLLIYSIGKRPIRKYRVQPLTSSVQGKHRSS